MKRKASRNYEIRSSRPEHFREAVARAEHHFPRLQKDHPCSRWSEAALRIASRPNHDVGDPCKPAATDAEFQHFTAETVVPAIRLCRLGRSLLSLNLLGGTPSEELKQMARDPDGFYHGEFLLHIGTKLAYKHRANVRVVPRGSQPTPDLELPDAKLAIECVAHEKIALWKSATQDFEHADSKFSWFFSTRPGWMGVLAIDLGFRGSPTLPDLGLPGPNHKQIMKDIDQNFELQAAMERDSGHQRNIHAVVLTWTSIECDEDRAPDGINALLVPTDISAVKYPELARRIRLLDKTFHPCPVVPKRTAYRSPGTL